MGTDEAVKDVTAAIIIENGRIFIARRPPGDPLAGRWEFPGGKVEQGETPEECLRRELWEELAMEVHVGEFFAESLHRSGDAAIRLLAYRVLRQSGPMAAAAHDALAWAPLQELGRYCFAPADIPLVEALAGEMGEGLKR